MKINLSYDSKMIQELIAKDIESKISADISASDIKIKVRSKQNYREKEWENGELKCELEVNI